MDFTLMWRTAFLLIVSLGLWSDVEGATSDLAIPDTDHGSRRLISTTELMSMKQIGGMLGTGLSVSPDGRSVAFEMHQADVEANRYRVAWFVASIDRPGQLVKVGGGGDATLFRNTRSNGRISGAWVAEYPKWSPDSRGIAYRKKHDGETQVWWSSRDGQDLYQLSHNAADVTAFHWSSDGSRILFAIDADRTELDRTKKSRFRNGHVYDYFKDWSTINGRPLYPAYLLTGGKPRIWVLEIESNTERPATTEERAEFEHLATAIPTSEVAPAARKFSWAKNGKGTAWLQPDDPTRQGRNPPLTLYASGLTDTQGSTRCSTHECTGVMDLYRFLRDGLHSDADQGVVYFVRREGRSYSKRSLYEWSVKQDRVRKVLTTHEWISDCSIVSGRALCFRETATYPRTIISIDLSDGSIETLVDPNPEFRNLKLGDVEWLEWENSLGYETFGYLVKPPDYVPGRRYPLVLVGYRARYALRGGVGDEYPVHALAANGYVVLVYDKPYPYEAEEIYSDSVDIGRARWGSDLFETRVPLASFKAVIQTLDEEGLIDPARVAITGLSAGVSDVNYSLIHSDLFAAAIASGSDFGPNNRVLIGASGGFREYLKAIGAGPYPGPHAFMFPQMSLALNAERVNTPLLVNVSDSEHPWALEEIVALIEHDKPVELVVYPDEGHVKWHPAHRAAIYERNIDWLNFWLRGVEDPSPEKTDQYTRWLRLRDARPKN